MPVQTVIKARRDTATNWNTTNPVLADGELGYDTTMRIFKIGNGTQTWTQLAAVSVSYAEQAGTATSATTATTATNATNATNQLITARNTTGATIAKGVPVYSSGANGTNILISKASNASEATSSKVLGLTTASVANNATNSVMTEGLLTGLNTAAATAGDPVWLGVDGALIYGLANKPVAPAHLVSLGVVTRVNASVGEIFVKVQNGFELEELHDVLITSKTDKDVLQYESATGLWKNKNIMNSPTFTGDAKFEDITLGDDALVKGTVTVRDDLSLTGVVVDLATVTGTNSNSIPTQFTSGTYPTGYDSAGAMGGVINISLAPPSLQAALTPGTELLLNGTITVTIDWVDPQLFPNAEVHFLETVSSFTNVTTIDVDLISTTVETALTDLDVQIDASGGTHILIGETLFKLSDASYDGSSITVSGEHSFSNGTALTIRSNDTSKINGVKYNGTLSSITFDPTSGAWSAPNLYVDTYQVTGLQTSLDEKSSVGHTHSITEIYDYVEPAPSPNPFLLMGA